MSLLLDALQRASKEKEKSAAGAGSTIAATPTIVEPAKTPLRFPDLQLQEPVEPQQESPAKLPAMPPLQLSVEPLLESVTESAALTSQYTHLPDQQVNTMAFSAPPAVEPNVSPSAHVAAAAPSSSTFASASAKPAMADSPRESLASPQVAREILAATAAAQATTGAASTKRVKRKRLLVLAVIGGFLALGGIALMFGLGGNLFDTAGTLGAPLRPLGNPIQPASTAGAPATPAELGNMAQVSSLPATSVSQAPSHESHKTEKPADQSSIAAVPTVSSEQTDQTVDAAIRKSPRRATPSPAGNQPLFVGRHADAGALEAGYTALTDGRFEEARVAYRLALQGNPEERDALLGLAYLAHRQGRLDEASALYQRVLRQDPKQPQAMAGLLALQAVGDMAVTTSRARAMAEQNPGSAIALTTLGHLLVREGRLADAQQAFFRALALEPQEALYAYNLAVALDRLHKYDLALRYYERASGLAIHATSNVQAAFPREVVQQRVEELRARGRADAALIP